MSLYRSASELVWDCPMEDVPQSPTMVAEFPTQRTDSNKRRRRRCVSFADHALVYPNDRTEDEVYRMWYSSEELAEFKKERRELVKVLKSLGFNLEAVDQTQHCLRGFEAYFSVEVNRATKYTRELALTVVFAEQNRQRVHCYFDWEALRLASQSATQWSLCNALDLGNRDAVVSYMLNVRDPDMSPAEFPASKKQTLFQEMRKRSLCREIRNVGRISEWPNLHPEKTDSYHL